MPILGIMASQISGHLGPGPTGAYDSLATISLSTSTASITFAGIPSVYKHLQIRGIAKNTNAIQRDIYVTFNSDTSSNYSWHRLYGDGSSAGSDAGADQSYMILGRASETGVSYFGSFIIDILDYANTNKYKTSRSLAGLEKNGSGSVWLNSGNWRSNNVVTSITLKAQTTDSFAQYSEFALYGVK